MLTGSTPVLPERVHAAVEARRPRVRGRRRSAGDDGAARALGGARARSTTDLFETVIAPLINAARPRAFRVLIPQLSAAELARWRADASRDAPLVVDVREPWELELCRIDGSLSIPLGERRARAWPSCRAIARWCWSAITAAAASTRRRCSPAAGFTQVHNLRAAWKRGRSTSIRR